MLRQFQPSLSRRRFLARRGMTLVELMVALLAASIIMAALLATTAFVSRSFIALGNYTDLDNASQIALDTMSRDIRNAKSLVWCQTNYIILQKLDGSLCRYTWDPSTSLFTRSDSTGTKVLLKNCDILTFYMYQRNPTNDFQFVAAPTANEAKLIDVSWRCSRSILGAIINSESVQTAKIVIRN